MDICRYDDEGRLAVGMGTDGNRSRLRRLAAEGRSTSLPPSVKEPHDAEASVLQAGVMGVDGRPGIIARRLGAAPLLGTPGLRWRREPRNLDLEFAPVARREFWGLGVERLTWDRAHGPSLLLASKRNTDMLLAVLVGEGEEP
jgi:hypothetical protein